MSKLVIVLFAVLTVVASQTPVNVGSSAHFYRGHVHIHIAETEDYATKQYRDAVEIHNKLKESIKEQGEKMVVNSDDYIKITTERARQQIDNLNDGVELLDDGVCLSHGARLESKATEASANLRNCVLNKSKISTDSELDDFVGDLRVLFSKAEVLRKGAKDCVSDKKSDEAEASKCVMQINSDAYALRSTMDENVTHFLAKIREMFANAEQSLSSCEKEYDVYNYAKLATSMVDEVARCFKSGAHAHHIPVDPDV